jgi:hypothetical protein
MKVSAYERVMRRIRKDKNDCWNWKGATNNAGYGLIRDDDAYKMVTVHRVVAKHMGIDISCTEVQHTCLNKLCVNPKHLTTGTVRDRTDRLINKYGSDFMYPDQKYMTCEHCGNSSYFTWFSRHHRHCYPGMHDGLLKLMNRKHK